MSRVQALEIQAFNALLISSVLVRGGAGMKFVPTQGTPITGQHKDKKQRITEVLSDLQMVLA